MRDLVEMVEMVPSAYQVSLVFGIFVLSELLGLTGSAWRPATAGVSPYVVAWAGA